jgi:hypothetical protein
MNTEYFILRNSITRPLIGFYNKSQLEARAMQLRAAIWTSHPFALAKGSAGKNIRALTTLGAGPASVY